MWSRGGRPNALATAEASKLIAARLLEALDSIGKADLRRWAPKAIAGTAAEAEQASMPIVQVLHHANGHPRAGLRNPDRPRYRTAGPAERTPGRPGARESCVAGTPDFVRVRCNPPRPCRNCHEADHRIPAARGRGRLSPDPPIPNGALAPWHTISGPGFCGPQLRIRRMRALRSSAPDPDLAHLGTNSLAVNRWIRAKAPIASALKPVDVHAQRSVICDGGNRGAEACLSGPRTAADWVSQQFVQILDKRLHPDHPSP